MINLESKILTVQFEYLIQRLFEFSDDLDKLPYEKIFEILEE